MTEKIGLEAVLDDSDFQRGIAEYQKSLDDATKATDEFSTSANESGKATDGVAEGLNSAGSSAKTASSGMADFKAGLDMVTTAIGYVQSVLSSVITDTIEYAMQVQDLSMMLGVNATEASTLIQVADDLRVSQGTLMVAFRTAAKDGITPNIDTLIQLAGQYQAIQDPADRLKFAMDTFGRSGVEMQRILATDVTELRNMAAAVGESGLALDEQGVAAADRMRLALDGIEDASLAVKLRLFDMVSAGVIPAADGAAALVSSLVPAIDNVRMIADAVSSGALSFWDFAAASLGSINPLENYTAAVEAARLATYNASLEENSRVYVLPQVTEATDILAQATAEWAGTADDAAMSVDAMSDEEEYWTDVASAAVDSTTVLEGAVFDLYGKFDEAKMAAQLMSDGLKVLSDSMIEQEKYAAALALAMGQITPAEYANRSAALDNLDAINQLNAGLETGQVTANEWALVLQDGVVTQEELARVTGNAENAIDDLGNIVQPTADELAAAFGAAPVGLTDIYNTVSGIYGTMNMIDGRDIAFSISIEQGGDLPLEWFIPYSPPPIVQGLNMTTEALAETAAGFDILGNAISDMPALPGFGKETPSGDIVSDYWLGMAKSFSGAGGGFGSIFKKRIIDPMTANMDSIDKALKDSLDVLGYDSVEQAQNALQMQGLYGRDTMSAEEIQNIQALINLDKERVKNAEKLAAEQERYNAMLKQQQDLDFLQKQFDLLDMIKEYGLNPEDILGGLQLGLGADVGALMDAMTRAMQEMIARAEDELGIHSPSSVFSGIGKNLMNSLAMSIADFSANPFAAMQNAMAGVTVPAAQQSIMVGGARSMVLNMGGVTITNGVDEQMFSARVERAVIRAMQN